MESPQSARDLAAAEWRNAVRTAHREKVRLCQPWRERFQNFLDDMGEPPAGAKLIRKDRGGPFTPENCQWRV